MPGRLQTRSILGMTALAMAVALQACASSDAGPGPAPSISQTGTEEPGDTGSVSFTLQAGANVSFSTVVYRIRRAAYDRSGTFDVSHSSSASGTIPGIPAATGYTLTLTTSAVANNRSFSCAGSSPVDVVAGAVAPVAVNIECHERLVAVPIPSGAVSILGLLLGLAGISALRRRAYA